MASSKKSVSENNTPAATQTKKKKKTAGSANATKNDNTTTKTKTKINTLSINGTVNYDEVPATPSSSSDSHPAVENGVVITKNVTSVTKSNSGKQKGKRERKEEPEEGEDAKMNKFPMERIRRIVRSDDSDMRITNEAVFLVNKATEKFIENFCGEAYACAIKDRKKSLAYKHLSSAVSKQKRYDFLSDFVPEKVKAVDALAERKLLEAEAP
ncbi:DNA polymerase II subunit B3-1 [Humulus lupulus]|uniref:DNA polymerase II subunit B3-1 n=1 Tax=Humulus lupulus TaxID=3486 RepID=UPI002B41840A|nr:DNA polymerase II subunit B3-1 [Humulus lupulus]